jgi:hypothetical protein
MERWLRRSRTLLLLVIVLGPQVTAAAPASGECPGWCPEVAVRFCTDWQTCENTAGEGGASCANEVEVPHACAECDYKWVCDGCPGSEEELGRVSCLLHE